MDKADQFDSGGCSSLTNYKEQENPKDRQQVNSSG